jgi:hypothetical protein
VNEFGIQIQRIVMDESCSVFSILQSMLLTEIFNQNSQKLVYKDSNIQKINENVRKSCERANNRRSHQRFRNSAKARTCATASSLMGHKRWKPCPCPSAFQASTSPRHPLPFNCSQYMLPLPLITSFPGTHTSSNPGPTGWVHPPPSG